MPRAVRPFRTAMRARSSATGRSKSGAIRRCSGRRKPRYGMLAATVFWRRDSVLKSGTDHFSPTSRRRLSAKPVVCRNTVPNNTSIVEHVWTAVSLHVCWRPRLPDGVACQVISGSNQIVSDELERFNVERPVLDLEGWGCGSAMPTGYQLGFTKWIPNGICAAKPCRRRLARRHMPSD